MNMTSGLGSLTESKTKNVPQCMAYSISKAGLNMLTVHQGIELGDEGVIVICMDPGWVKDGYGWEGCDAGKGREC
jgi:NAD(P)-dependent dehydrogenase (short-subunit alcohol dehydrogenase family)